MEVFGTGRSSLDEKAFEGPENWKNAQKENLYTGP
jgi:hypothetical protein